MGEAHRAAGLGQLGELLGMVVAADRQVRGGRAQVLAQRDDGYADLAKIAQRGQQLVALLAQAQDDPGFQRQPGRGGPGVTE